MENTQTQTPVVDTEIVIRKFQGFRWDIAEKAHIKTYALDLYDKPSFQGTIYDAAVQAIQTLPLDRQRPAKFENIFFCHPKLHRNMKFVDIDKLELSAIRHDVMEKKRLDPFLYDPDCADPTAVTLEQLYNLIFDLQGNQLLIDQKIETLTESLEFHQTKLARKSNRIAAQLENVLSSISELNSKVSELTSNVLEEPADSNPVLLFISSEELDIGYLAERLPDFDYLVFNPNNSELSDLSNQLFDFVFIDSSTPKLVQNLVQIYFGDRTRLYSSQRELYLACKGKFRKGFNSDL